MENLIRKALPEITIEQIVSELDYGIISENNITKNDLDAIHYYLEWFMNSQEYQIATKATKLPKFKVGDAVLFAYTYGDTLETGKSRYGEAVVAIVTKVEFIPARDAYLYTVTRESNWGNKFVSAVRGESYLFKLDELDACNKFIESQLV